MQQSESWEVALFSAVKKERLVIHYDYIQMVHAGTSVRGDISSESEQTHMIIYNPI